MLMLRETDINLDYGVAHELNVVDELFDCGFIDESEIANLNIYFLNSFLFAACVQLQIKRELKEYTVNRIVKLIKEIDKRTEYYVNLNNMMAILINSSGEDILFKEIPDFNFLDLMINKEIIEKESISHRVVLSSEEIELAISKIITKICYDARESNYLALIPTCACTDDEYSQKAVELIRAGIDFRHVRTTEGNLGGYVNAKNVKITIR